MTDLETVYAVHNFEAENEDELTFEIGEPVIVIQKDDGFNDGWWKGKNMRGEIGLFPVNYITYESILPTPSSSTKPHHIDTSLTEDSPSVRSSYSFTCPVSSSMVTTNSNISNTTNCSNVLRRLVISTLFLPLLRSKSPEEWNMDQVEVWLNAMNFGSIAANFKSQEITGDILIELNMEALKELDVPTFGKRFKVHTALNVLREECGYPIIPSSNNRLSQSSSIYSSTNESKSSPTSTTTPSPNSSRFSNPIYNKQSSTASYHSNLMVDSKQRKSQQQQIVENEEDESIKSPPILSPTSNYDIMEASMKNYQNDHPNNSPKDANLARVQQQHTVLPMAHRSSMDIYSIRASEETGNAIPDMEGWLHKQGCKYKKWNKRWFVLKGANLFYFKSPKDVRMKGIINLRGYRIVPDETIQPGKYSFKAQHEEERTFYFYTDVDTSMKAWMSSLMKATISRDFNSPVLSSSAIPTVSLDVARRMRPRPPSVLLYRKEKVETPKNNSSSISDELLLLTNQDSGFDSDPQQSNVADNETEPFDFDNEEEEDEGHFEEIEELEEDNPVSSWSSVECIQWVNTICSSVKINSLSELRQGDALIELLEELSGKTVKQLPPSTIGSISMLMLDNIVAVFKFLSVEGIEIEDQFTIKDIFSGREDKIKIMLQMILDWSIQINDQ